MAKEIKFEIKAREELKKGVDFKFYFFSHGGF